MSRRRPRPTSHRPRGGRGEGSGVTSVPERTLTGVRNEILRWLVLLFWVLAASFLCYVVLTAPALPMPYPFSPAAPLAR